MSKMILDKSVRRKIYLFPGAHKTASSFLQHGLECNRKLLESRGVAIAHRGSYYASGLRNVLLRKNAVAQTTPGTLSPMFHRVFGTDPSSSHIVISIENAFGEIRPNIYRRSGIVVDNLNAAFPEHEIHVVFYIRRQDTFLESAYIQSLHRGTEESLEDFFEPFHDAAIDWAEAIRPVVERLGRRNVKVVPFESIRDGGKRYMLRFFRHFSDLSQRRLFANIDFDDADTNRTLSAIGIKVARAGFPHLPDPSVRRLLVKALQREFAVDRFERFRIPSELRERIKANHVEVNRKLALTKLLRKPYIDYYGFLSDKV